MTETHRPHRFADRLDVEWRSISTSRRTIGTIRSWVDDAPSGHATTFARVRSANDLIGATQRSAGNELLLVLVELARRDELAGRIVIQRLLPGLISSSVRYRCLSESDDPVADAVGAAWIAIRNYDTTTRPRHVAASLISDAMYLAFRRHARQNMPDATVTSPHVLGERIAVSSASAFVELADVVRTARHAGVATHDLELIGALVRTGSPSAVARQQRVTPRTIRNRRDRAIDQLRQVVAVAA